MRRGEVYAFDVYTPDGRTLTLREMELQVWRGCWLRAARTLLWSKKVEDILNVDSCTQLCLV